VPPPARGGVPGRMQGPDLQIAEKAGQTDRFDSFKDKEMTKIFPSILIVLDIAASIVYACSGDWRKAVYWFAAAVLTFVVTF